MSHNEEIAKSAGNVGVFTLLSRIFGYIRDMVIAYYFGANTITDAFYFAYRIPNLLRRLFAEGSLTISFIPVFTEYLEKKGEGEAREVSNLVFTFLFLILVCITVLGVVFSPVLIEIFASGFTSEEFELAVELNRIMFPYIFFISLSALMMGILNSLKRFFAPAFSPVLFNITIILTAVVLHGIFGIPIISLAIGVILGGIIQFIFQYPFIRSLGFGFRFSKIRDHPAIRKIILLLIPQIFGLAVYNLNIIVNTQYASYMPGGTISYLFFAERLIEFPLGIIAVSIATVMLPTLSSHASTGAMVKYRENYNFTLHLMLFVLIPALVGLIVLREPICNLLYQRGEFDYQATLFTSQTLLGYAVGLWAVGGIRITAPAFYALQDTKTPVKIAFAAFIVNAVLGFVLGFTLNMNHTGLALASSFSSIFNFILLLYFLNLRLGVLELRKTLIFVIKVVVISIIMGLLVWKISTYVDWTTSGFAIEKIVTMGIAIGAAMVSYVILAYLLRIEEAGFLIKLAMKRIGRGRDGD